jgi:hypothetical protein
MPIFYQYFTAYLIISFLLGVIWHVVLFKKYYKKLAIYSNIEKPRFSFGFLAMVLQGIVFAYVYSLIVNPWIFALGLCMLLVSFMVFAEGGKQNSTSLSGFVIIQIAFSIIQTVFVTVSFLLLS